MISVKSNPRKHYIYLITNNLNQKMYVGKSVSPKNRWRDHKKFALGGKEKYPNDFSVVHAAIRKYGINNFKFEILEDFNSEEEAYWFETWWIEFLETFRKHNGYNCNHGGLGGIQPNEQTRQKLIDYQNKPEVLIAKSKRAKKYHKNNPGYLAKHNIGNKYTQGRKLSDEQKEKISKSSKGHKKSSEIRKKMSLAQTGSNHSQAKLNEEQVKEIRAKYIYREYSCTKLGKEYNVDPETIRDIITRKRWNHI